MIADILFWLVVGLLGIGAVANFLFSHHGNGGSSSSAFFMVILMGILLVSFFLGATVVEGGAHIPALMAFWTLTTFWFWAFLFVGAVIVVSLFLNELEGYAFSAFAATMILLLCLAYGFSNVGYYIINHKAFLAIMFFSYFGIAPFVMFLRWVVFNWDQLEQYEDGLSEFVRTNGNDRERWSQYTREQWERINRPFEAPKARQYKKRLIRYMMYWPLHLIDLILHDFLWRVFKRVYQLCIPLLDDISARIARNAQTPQVR